MYQPIAGTAAHRNLCRRRRDTGPLNRRAIREMLKLNPPAFIKRRLRRKYAASLYCLSDTERQDGCYRAAWRYHLRSLASPYGIPYLLYTRLLLRPKRTRKPAAGGRSPG